MAMTCPVSPAPPAWLLDPFPRLPPPPLPPRAVVSLQKMTPVDTSRTSWVQLFTLTPPSGGAVVMAPTRSGVAKAEAEVKVVSVTVAAAALAGSVPPASREDAAVDAAAAVVTGVLAGVGTVPSGDDDDAGLGSVVAGDAIGATDGVSLVGRPEGSAVVGVSVGRREGTVVGRPEGSAVAGVSVGRREGSVVGVNV